MDMPQYHRVRTAIQQNASPGSDEDLRVMESRLRELLVASALFEDVEVGHTDDPDQLLVALGGFRAQFSPNEVATRVETIWREEMVYPFWEAHCMLVGDGHVEMEGATRESAEGHYVTVHLVAQRA